jgi:hypothetical protein
MLKEVLSGMQQAVQGSIDATATPSTETEEDAFRQNQGRELGAIGAWRAASMLSPLSPGGAGRILSRMPIGPFRNGLSRLEADAPIVANGADGSIAGLSAPAPRLVSRNPNLSPEAQNLPGVANAITEMARRKKREPHPDDPPWLKQYWEGVLARAAERHAQFSGGDNGSFCSNRKEEEDKRCYERSHEYPDWDFLQACLDRATERRNLCNKNGGKPDPGEPSEWGPKDEEVYRNGWMP